MEKVYIDYDVLYDSQRYGEFTPQYIHDIHHELHQSGYKESATFDSMLKEAEKGNFYAYLIGDLHVSYNPEFFEFVKNKCGYGKEEPGLMGKDIDFSNKDISDEIDKLNINDYSVSKSLTFQNKLERLAKLYNHVASCTSLKEQMDADEYSKLVETAKSHYFYLDDDYDSELGNVYTVTVGVNSKVAGNGTIAPGDYVLSFADKEGNEIVAAEDVLPTPEYPFLFGKEADEIEFHLDLFSLTSNNADVRVAQYITFSKQPEFIKFSTKPAFVEEDDFDYDAQPSMKK